MKARQGDEIELLGSNRQGQTASRFAQEALEAPNNSHSNETDEADQSQEEHYHRDFLRRPFKGRNVNDKF